MRLAIEEATSMDAAEMMLLMEKMDPSSPSGRENLRWKKLAIQDLVSISNRDKRSIALPLTERPNRMRTHPARTG